MLDTATGLAQEFLGEATGAGEMAAGMPMTTSLRQLGNVTTRKLRPREPLFHEGDARSSVYRVLTGVICLYKLTNDGRRQIIEFVFPGDIVGLESADVHSICADAVKDSSVLCLPVTAMHRLFDGDARFHQRLYERLSRELEATRERLLTLGRRTALERVAGFLRDLSQRAASRGGDPHLLDLPMTRSDIADALGLTIETVSRCFTRLRRKGLIKLTDRTGVELVDLETIATLAAGEE